ncbi:MAG: IS30 family transposase, partial [Candidatus Marinimicrobia bacterium]|nr:IS30 family transposase [Candidatus Neomarinimicrobiota bacterium]
EADTIIGKRHKQAIVSVTERKSRLSLIYKVEQKTSDQVTKAINRFLLPIKHSGNCLTVTSDNGKEFAGHEVLAKKLDAKFYFAHPYSILLLSGD